MLDLKLADPGWLPQRQLDDLIPDHNHLMHLYLIRWPQMDVVFHLHPEPTATGEFQLALPSMPAGNYHLYADVVHSNGFPETMVAAVMLPQISGRPLAGDDAEGLAKPLAANRRGDRPHLKVRHEEKFSLPDGYTMVWKMPDALVAKAPEDFRFELLDPEGKPPADMALYMGMLGHAAFVKTDGTVFAHIHPTGTMAMAAFMMANPQASMTRNRKQHYDGYAEHAGNDYERRCTAQCCELSLWVSDCGEYRIFIQMKHGNTVETGVFDAEVKAPTT